MSHSLVLVDNGFMALRVIVLNLGLSAIVEQELGKVEVALLASGKIEPCHSHLGNLVAGHHTHLTRVGTHLLASHVGITVDAGEKAVAVDNHHIGF